MLNFQKNETKLPYRLKKGIWIKNEEPKVFSSTFFEILRIAIILSVFGKNIKFGDR